MAKPYRVIHRLRISASDAHYAGELVDGARVLQAFGDAATDLLIQSDGTEGLFRAYSEVEFLAPVYAGDFLEIGAEIVRFGKTSRTLSFFAYKVIEASRNPRHPDRARVLKKPLLVAKAIGTCVVSKKKS